jgi:hypothetical protein
MSVVLVTGAEALAAWRWMSSSIPARPARGAPVAYNDLASWADRAGRLLHDAPAVVGHLVALYLASHTGLLVELLELVNNDATFDVSIAGPKLDGEVKKLYRNKTRFRASLGEHLAFWVTVAQHRRVGAGSIAITSPHHLSEDKGPDGIVFRELPTPSCEIISVKQSPKGIAGLMSSARFRNGKAPRTKKMLDDLYRFARQGYGFARVEKLVAEVMSHAHVAPTVTATRALLTSASYQGVALSTHTAGASKLYDGFHRVAAPQRCIGTFVGSPDWEALAESVRTTVERRLRKLAVW